jgi:hypothetical protein
MSEVNTWPKGRAVLARPELDGALAFLASFLASAQHGTIFFE